MLLIHLGCGHSLGETEPRAREAQLAELEFVALWKRLRKSQDWLRALYMHLFWERGVGMAAGGGASASDRRDNGEEGRPVGIAVAQALQRAAASVSLRPFHADRDEGSVQEEVLLALPDLGR